MIFRRVPCSRPCSGYDRNNHPRPFSRRHPLHSNNNTFHSHSQFIPSSEALVPFRLSVTYSLTQYFLFYPLYISNLPGSVFNPRDPFLPDLTSPTQTLFSISYLLYTFTVSGWLCEDSTPRSCFPFLLQTFTYRTSHRYSAPTDPGPVYKPVLLRHVTAV